MEETRIKSSIMREGKNGVDDLPLATWQLGNSTIARCFHRIACFPSIDFSIVRNEPSAATKFPSCSSGRAGFAETPREHDRAFARNNFIEGGDRLKQ